MAARKPKKPDYVVAYENGASVVQIASMLHVAIKTARNTLVSQGVTIRPVGRPRKVVAKK